MSKTYSNEEIKLSLEAYAPLENYFINKQKHIIGEGLIMFFDKNGQLFIDKHSDNDFNDACVDYLIRFGTPVFKTLAEIEAYKEQWKGSIDDE